MTESKRLVVLTPGWGSSTFYLKNLQNKFKAEGFDVLIVPNDGKELEESALKLSYVLERVHPYYEHISFVGCSMGGLVGRYLINEFPETNYINSYVSIATPHSGCYLAELAPWSKTAIQMKRNSLFLKLLNEAEWPLQIPALAIQAEYDEIVQPHASTKFKYAENITIPRTSHLSVILSSRTFYEIYSWISSIFFPNDFKIKPTRKGISSRLQYLL